MKFTEIRSPGIAVNGTAMAHPGTCQGDNWLLPSKTEVVRNWAEVETANADETRVVELIVTVE
jgi:hypothetical protein